MRINPTRLLNFCVLAFLPLNLVLAEPARWPGNGHFYDVIVAPGTISWEDARDAAISAGGYLATITSAAENAFVYSLVNNGACWQGYSGPWLGGYQSPATQQPNANWHWVSGEAWTYSNWQSGQPNDSGGKAEDKLQFGFATLSSTWNDIMSIDPTPDYRPIAYVVEWNSDPLAPALQIRKSEGNSQVQLCWPTSPNRFYQLWYSSVLNSNAWAPLTTNWYIGDGTWRCEPGDLLANTPLKFYRLLVTNSPPNLAAP